MAFVSTLPPLPLPSDLWEGGPASVLDAPNREALPETTRSPKAIAPHPHWLWGWAKAPRSAEPLCENTAILGGCAALMRLVLIGISYEQATRTCRRRGKSVGYRNSPTPICASKKWLRPHPPQESGLDQSGSRAKPLSSQKRVRACIDKLSLGGDDFSLGRTRFSFGWASARVTSGKPPKR